VKNSYVNNYHWQSKQSESSPSVRIIMKKKTTPQSAFFNLRVLTGLSLALAGVFLGVLGFGQFSAQAQSRTYAATKPIDPLVPALFDCSSIHNLGIDKQENFRAGAIAIYCGEAQGGSPTDSGDSSSFVQELLAPLFGGADVDLVTGTDSNPSYSVGDVHPGQSG
jgi:hypothetical protein